MKTKTIVHPVTFEFVYKAFLAWILQRKLQMDDDNAEVIFNIEEEG